jgi:hypothetical protein
MPLARVVELVDTGDLKSPSPRGEREFESRPGHSDSLRRGPTRSDSNPHVERDSAMSAGTVRLGDGDRRWTIYGRSRRIACLPARSPDRSSLRDSYSIRALEQRRTPSTQAAPGHAAGASDPVDGGSGPSTGICCARPCSSRTLCYPSRTMTSRDNVPSELRLWMLTCPSAPSNAPVPPVIAMTLSAPVIVASPANSSVPPASWAVPTQ